MIKPYYSEKNITIYHGDCRDILPSLPKVDLVLTDPPYGININTQYATKGRSTNIAKANDYPPVYGDDKPFDPTMWISFENVVLWGANYFADKLPTTGKWLIWDKRDGDFTNDQADCELAWRKGGEGNIPRIFRHMWCGAFKASERSSKRVHPTQKPEELMRWCIGFYPKCNFILDPYMGSGPTLRAAKDLGRRAIGIEIEEKYCEIAVKRLRQEVLPLA